MQRINVTKSLIFEKINMIEKSLSKLTKRQSENIQIKKKIRNKIRHNRHQGNLGIMRTLFKNLYLIKMENIKEMDNILVRYYLPKLSQD